MEGNKYLQCRNQCHQLLLSQNIICLVKIREKCEDFLFLELLVDYSDRKKGSQEQIKLFSSILIYHNHNMKSPVYFQPDPSFQSLDYTYAFSKYSCISWVYPLHIIFAYLVALSGLLALLSRVIPKLQPYHTTFGRWYLIFMLWCMASSLVIHNTGLPMPILVSFLYLLTSITIGWNVIKLYMSKFNDTLTERVNEKLNYIIGKSSSWDKALDIKEIEKEERQKLIVTKSFSERFFSTRMLHGLLMTFSWSQMVGRIFVTNPFTTFNGCWTYPAYKTLDSNAQVYAVDGVSTPPFPMQQGAFIALITAPTIIVILTVACLTTFCYYKSDAKIKDASPTASEVMVQ